MQIWRASEPDKDGGANGRREEALGRGSYHHSLPVAFSLPGQELLASTPAPPTGPSIMSLKCPNFSQDLHGQNTVHLREGQEPSRGIK